MLSFVDFAGNLPLINVVDIGASPIDGDPPYQKLIDLNKTKVIGFEPDTTQYLALLSQNTHPGFTFLPFAIGDGKDGVLHICKAPGMTSLLEPDMNILNKFHGFDEWGTVVNRQNITTIRLDDVQEVTDIDYLKIDVQGSELAVLQGGEQAIKNACVIHIEAQFVPFYKDQPLFGELDIALREAGFFLHRFTPLVSRVFKPMVIDNNIFGGLSQILWSDAIYVKKFTEFEGLSEEKLLKIAFMVHDLYGSFDLSSFALGIIDKKSGSQKQPDYLEWLNKS